jgi:predicted dithiol-disulfide oxidoreductase (DUF899 family)
MQPHKIVSREEWTAARQALLTHEKQLTRARDRLSAERRELPWVKVEKNYVFDGPNGKETLADLFGGRSQLIVNHFMLAPGWKEGCIGCSFGADKCAGRAGASGATRRRLCRGIARAAGRDRGLQEADGLEFQMGVVIRQ